jgi:hypothetical protein
VDRLQVGARGVGLPQAQAMFGSIGHGINRQHISD